MYCTGYSCLEESYAFGGGLYGELSLWSYGFHWQRSFSFLCIWNAAFSCYYIAKLQRFLFISLN